MQKLTKRKGFNFYRSYYDVFNELPKKEKLEFITALLDRQFLGKEPNNLTGLSKFAYISQQFNVDRQIKGFEDKTGIQLIDNQAYSTPCVGPTEHPCIQEKEEEKEEEKEKVSSNQSYTNFVDYINTTYSRKFKALKKFQDKYKSIRKIYSYEELKSAIDNAYKDEFHIKENYKYLTVEFFTREDKIEKYSNILKEVAKSTNKYANCKGAW